MRAVFFARASVRVFVLCAAVGLFLLISAPVVLGDPLPVVTDVESQPLKSQAKRIQQALQFLGQPLGGETARQLESALNQSDPEQAVADIQRALDPLCLIGVNINAESRVKVQLGPAPKQLLEQGWQVHLIKVHNEAGVTAPLQVSSPNAAPLYKRSTGHPDPELTVRPSDVENRWLDVEMFDGRPLLPTLSGLVLEYRIIQLYSRQAGKREATLAFDVGQGTQDLGFRNQTPVLFACQPAVQVTLRVWDTDGTPTTGQFVFRDAQGRVYPARSRRLAPDFFFHDQIYRHSGESVQLPPGEYEVTYSRGPEYRIKKRQLVVRRDEPMTVPFQLERWIHMAERQWYSGDHHIHAAGCSHYEAPTQGVEPDAMMRHILGEDLNIGCVLSWGPCWYFQKQFFDGKVHELSEPGYLMRYDVEVSGFPSSHAGHLCLLRLKEDDYPGTTKIEEWPSWDLPILKWGKQQGGVVGFSHSGWGLQVPGDELPNYNMPRFDGIGANEYIVDVVHGVCDFISAVDTPAVWELNIWYHTLNCGYQCRISGETDFPCIYGERVGLGRVYVKLPEDQPLAYDPWVRGIRDGRSYCSDGLTHLFDFQVNDLAMGTQPNKDAKPSVLNVSSGEELDIRVRAAGWLEEKPRDDIRQRSLNEKPYWHIERARVGQTRTVPVELIVNGQSVEQKEVVADGTVHDLRFQYEPKQSSWIAVRVFPAAHTNPVFVQVDGKPIRASRRSAKWCLDAVDVCWNAKKSNIREAERPDAAAAFDVARKAYQQILQQCTTE